MRVKRHKKEIYVIGLVLISSLLLIASVRAEENTYAPGGAVGPFPANNSSAQEILKRARGSLPADQYDAFEKAMKKIETGNTGAPAVVGPTAPNRAGVPGEPVIDGATIPSTITFDRQGQPTQSTAQQPQPNPPVATQPQPTEPDRAPAEAPLPTAPQPAPVDPGPPVPTQPAQPQPVPAQPAAPKPAVPAPAAAQPKAVAPAPAKPGSKAGKQPQFYDPSFPSPDPVK